MQQLDIVIIAVTLLILAEVTYLLSKLPKTTSMKTKSRAVLVDTSVLMDGRIVTVASTGFIGGALVIPRSVIGELQFLADHADADKRARARSGLDVVSDLQKMANVEVEILQDGSKAEEGVDERLLSLAKQHQAVICTLDFNLNKVAVVEGVTVLNINELAQGLRMSYLPGEQMMIELQQKGQDNHQGVGYLPDGTMVVVEQSSGYIGQTVLVEVVRSLQTTAGRMMFARRIETKVSTQQETKPSAQITQKSKTTGRMVVRKKAATKQYTDKPVLTQPTRMEARRTMSTGDENKSTHATAVLPKRTRQTVSSNRTTTSRHLKNQKKQIDHEAKLIELVDTQKVK